MPIRCLEPYASYRCLTSVAREVKPQITERKPQNKNGRDKRWIRYKLPIPATSWGKDFYVICIVPFVILPREEYFFLDTKIQFYLKYLEIQHYKAVFLICISKHNRAGLHML